MRPVISRGTLWTLEKNGKTAQADVHEIENIGLELRFLWNGELMESRLFRSGPDLLAEAATKRFDLESRGWAPIKPLASWPLRSAPYTDNRSA